jgi:protein-disulfide isomerase/uncharacterized membrane protein
MNLLFSFLLKSRYILLFFIAVIGFGDASYLTWVHFSASKACGAGDGCSAVLASPWASIYGIPVASLGAGLYLALACFAAQILYKRETIPVNEPWMLMISSAGFGVSLFFTVVQAAVIRQWCPFCLLSAGLTTAFFLICLWSCIHTRSWRPPMKKPALLYSKLSWALLAFALPSLTVLTVHQERSGMGQKPVAENQIVAVIGDKTYTLADVDGAIRLKLQQLDEERFRARKAFLDAELLALEAFRRKLTPEMLIQQEIYAKIEVTQPEISQFIHENRSMLPQQIDPELIKKIENRIRQKKTQAAQADYMTQLKHQQGVQFSLPLPERLTIETNPRGGPIKGPANAAVTIIVFTDFECPFCRKTHQKLHTLMDRFAGKIRLAFRHFPLSYHQWAGQAAEFAYCVQQQEHFWSFADSIFAHNGQLSELILSDYVRKSGVTDMEAFNHCIQTGQGKQAVANDIAEGKQFGIHSTPSLFINGRFFIGMPEDIDAVIQEEIDRSPP